MIPICIKNLELEGKNSEGETVFVKVKNICKIEETESMPSIQRNDQRTYLTVSASLEEGYNVTLVTEDAKEALKELNLPEGVENTPIRITIEVEKNS